jgi:hypothetical protein
MHRQLERRQRERLRHHREERWKPCIAERDQRSGVEWALVAEPQPAAGKRLVGATEEVTTERGPVLELAGEGRSLGGSGSGSISSGEGTSGGLTRSSSTPGRSLANTAAALASVRPS